MTAPLPQAALLPNASEPVKLAVLSGSGVLPVQVAQNALKMGYDVYAFVIDKANVRPFQQLLGANKVFSILPGLMNRNFALGHQLGIQQVVMAGKVNKWVLLRAPILDARALSLWNKRKEMNDDTVMLTIIREFELEGFSIVPQTDFMQGLFVSTGVYTHRQPTDKDWTDIQYGLRMAKEMGRLDVGQTVIVSNGMVIAVEAIEGTDQAILRSKRWVGKQGGVVAKVEKPEQDKRFDVPTVGVQTLKSMRKAGLHILAFEADKTITVEFDAMCAYANRYNMSIVAQ